MPSGPGIEIWIRLPRDRWPSSWEGMRDPVVLLRLEIYGHPDSGSFWERQCEECLPLMGFRTMPGWPGVFTHETLRVVLARYVDDFKFLGVDQEPAWKAISDAVNVEPPTELGRCLC